MVITNYPEDKIEYFEVSNNPNHPELGTRKLPFTREIYIDRDDFAEVPPPKFFRMKPDGEVRLMGAYIVKCNEIIKDENGEIIEDMDAGKNLIWSADENATEDGILATLTFQVSDDVESGEYEVGFIVREAYDKGLHLKDVDYCCPPVVLVYEE